MIADPLQFPENYPDAYVRLENEPIFDPCVHLALEAPERLWTLDELGYTDQLISEMPGPIAFTSPFRLMSAEGAGTLKEIARDLQKHAEQSAENESYQGNRNLTVLNGGVYRSRFLRDLCNCPEITDFLSGIAGTPLGPHSLPSQQAYINYAPPCIEDHVDIWHTDSIGFDYVLMASDPATLKGGEFEIFLGTREEAAQVCGLGANNLNMGFADGLSPDRVLSFRFPDIGYAIFQQGNYVVHRARKLDQPGERITIVPGFMCLDTRHADITDVKHMATYGEPGIEAEILRHGAWLALTKLQGFIADFDPNQDLVNLETQLSTAKSEIERVLAATRSRNL